jgi:hypothetical protein
MSFEETPLAVTDTHGFKGCLVPDFARQSAEMR